MVNGLHDIIGVKNVALQKNLIYNMGFVFVAGKLKGIKNINCIIRPIIKSIGKRIKLK
jgi:hypothetical protein